MARKTMTGWLLILLLPDLSPAMQRHEIPQASYSACRDEALYWWGLYQQTVARCVRLSQSEVIR